MSFSFVLIDKEFDTLFSPRGHLDKESKDHSPTPVSALSAAEHRVSTLWYLIFLLLLCSPIQQILFLSQIDTHSPFHTTHHTRQLTTHSHYSPSVSCSYFCRLLSPYSSLLLYRNLRVAARSISARYPTGVYRRSKKKIKHPKKKKKKK